MNIDKIIEENNYSPTPPHHMHMLVPVPAANNFHHYHHHHHSDNAMIGDAAALNSSNESAVATPTTPTHTTQHQGDEVRLKVLVQPDDVQVKRVGRASCIEPELKVSLETDSLYPQTVVINAYLKVLGKDNKHKLILLRKSDEILMTKVHRREMINMKLRFLKTIKVQVLKRNLGVARPEASVIFEVVNRHGEVLSEQETTHFAIISDPRYLDEVKKRRVGERSGDGVDGVAESDDDSAYHPPTIMRALKRRRLTTGEYEGPVSSGYPLLSSGDISIKEEPSSPSSPCSSPESPSSPSFDAPISSPPIYLTPLQTLKSLSDFELFADSEEEYKLIKLVESLKYRGCGQQHYNFQVLPFELSRGPNGVCM